MDPVSQGALGSALSTSVARRRQAAAAAAVGALAGMAPDLDVLIRSSTDPLLFLEYHRQFTHALAFIPIGALICAGLLHVFVRRVLAFRETYLFALLGYGTHGLLDACTSYGTQLLWPFSDARLAWNAVAVIDPLFTVPVLVLVVAAVWPRRPRERERPAGAGRLRVGRPGLARLALGWAVVYVGLGAVQGGRAEAGARALAESRGHQVERLLVKPSFANLLVWKSVYEAGGWFHVDAIRAGFDLTYFPGDRVPRLDVGRALPWLAPGSVQASDLERFSRFSQGFLAPARGREHAVIDVRYSLVPNEIDPLWGIRLDPRNQGRHAQYFTERLITDAERAAFLEMLLEPGRPIPAPGD